MKWALKLDQDPFATFLQKCESVWRILSSYVQHFSILLTVRAVHFISRTAGLIDIP